MNTIGTPDFNATTELVRLAKPGMDANHQSMYCRWEVVLPSGRVMVMTIPLDSAIAIENAGYTIRSIDRIP